MLLEHFLKLMLKKKKIDNRITHCNLAWKGNPKKGWTTGSPNQPLSVQARQEANDRRLFVHSLAWKTDDESLRNAFREFGELVEAVVIRDKKSGKSKGYGFVTFKHAESARAALSNPSKMIDSRKTRCNYASSRDTKLYSDTDTNGATSPEPVDLNGSNGSNDGNGNGSDDISFNPNGNGNIMNIPPRGLTPSSTQQQTFLNMNGLSTLFPEDIHFQINSLNKSQNPNADMYLRSAARPGLSNFNSNSTFSNFNPPIFNMNNSNPSPHNNNNNNNNNPNNMNNVPINNGNNLLLSNPLSGAFVMSNNNNNNNTNNNINNANNNINKMMNNLNGLISSPTHQNNMSTNPSMNMMNNMNMMNMNMMNNMNKPGIIVHAANNIQVPNTPPMYAHLSSPIKAPSVSSVHSFLTPAAPVPVYVPRGLLISTVQ
jgi:RNA recognition motif-containing protein